MEYWTILGIPPTTDRKVVKKAYSSLLKKTRPDSDPEGYQRLREAFDWAVGYCKHMAAQADVEEVDSEQTGQTVQGVNGDADEHLIEKDEGAHSANVDREASAIDSKRELAARMAANEKARQKSAEHEASPEDATKDKEAEAAESKRLVEQRAYDDALAAINSIFDQQNPQEEVARFKTLVEGEALLNLKTRSYFEAILLNALSNQGGTDFPYELVFEVAEEFHWFEEQHSHPEKRQRIAYLQARINAHRSFVNGIIYTSRSGEAGEREAAKILIGERRPWYFQFMRFFGNYNGSIRKYTRYFAPLVENGLCPELDTETFHWWAKTLERKLYSLWHILVSGVLTLISSPFLVDHLPAVAEKFIPAVFASLVGLGSLIIWGLDTLYAKFLPKVVSFWFRIKDLKTTESILSFFAVVSVFIWRSNPDVDHIGWLIVLSLIASLLLFGIEGLFMMLGASAIYWVCYMLVDPLGHYSFLASYSLVAGFFAQKLYIVAMNNLPVKVNQYIVENQFLRFFTAGLIAVVISLSFLILYTL